MAEITNCNACGSFESAALFDGCDDPWQYVRCQSCGLVYLNPRPDWNERSRFYSAKYAGYHRLATEPSAIQRRSIEYGLEKRFRLIARHAAPGRLLDVGCGGGDFVAWVNRKSGWQAFGSERVEAMAAAARREHDANALVGDQHNLGVASESFDVLTLWTVLEHLDDPARGLGECARVLRPGGLLVVRTVDSESWPASWFGPDWLGYDAPRILYVFSRPVLKRMLTQNGFRIAWMGCYFNDYYPSLWSLQNRLERRVQSGRWRRLICRLAASWIARLLSYPFFALQRRAEKNSHFTALAYKDEYPHS
jgi:ubiquinone/menaquinone biosynthesis C-methylase UbiE